jgi:hypothetical protein
MAGLSVSGTFPTVNFFIQRGRRTARSTAIVLQLGSSRPSGIHRWRAPSAVAVDTAAASAAHTAAAASRERKRLHSAPRTRNIFFSLCPAGQF